MPDMQYVFCLIVLLAALSPLLTFSRLFQVKEWRWDRLREHLRREGRFRQLFGIVRPSVVAVGILAFVILRVFGARAPWDVSALWIAWTLLAWFTLFRFVVGRQARPVWTAKAILISATSLVMISIVGWVLCMFEEHIAALVLTTVLPLSAFLFVLFSWSVFLPLDRTLKSLIIKRAQAIRSRCKNIAVIGITGSVGKTTTKELLAHILSDRKLLVTPAHVNTDMGVANTVIQKLSSEHQIFIVEMGAYRRNEIELLCSIVRPHIGIITFVGKQHLGLFGSQEDLVQAKGELFASLPADGHAFLNADTEFSESLMKRAACPVKTVGTGGHATYEAFEIEEQPMGIAFTMRGTEFFVPLHGTHQVSNILLAAACAEVLGVPIAESAKRLKSFKAPEQTFERKDGQSGQTILDDTHNASPESFRAAIEWARTHGAKKKLLITSGLLELGKAERGIHEELGLLSRNVFDEVIFLSKKCVRYFEQGFGRQIRVFPKKKFAMKVEKDMLIVCEGRMAESVVDKLML